GSCDSVNLIENHRARRCEHSASAQRSQHDVERFGRRYENVRRLANHALALACRRIAGAHCDADLRKGETGLLESPAQLGERPLEIALDVVVERLERRHVQQMHTVRERRREPLDDERVELPQKGGERLSGSSRCENQGVVAARDYRPSLNLWRRWCTECLGEPFADYGMEVSEWIWRYHCSVYSSSSQTLELAYPSFPRKLTRFVIPAKAGIHLDRK